MATGHEPLVQLVAGRVQDRERERPGPWPAPGGRPRQARHSSSARIPNTPMCPSLRMTKSSPASGTKRRFGCAERAKISAAQPTTGSQLQANGRAPRIVPDCFSSIVERIARLAGRVDRRRSPTLARALWPASLQVRDARSPSSTAGWGTTSPTSMGGRSGWPQDPRPDRMRYVLANPYPGPCDPGWSRWLS